MKRSASTFTATWQFGSQPARPPKIDVGAAPRQLRTGVDDHAAVLRLDQAVVDHVGQRERIVHGRPVPAVPLAVKAGIEAVQVGDQLAGAACGGEPVDVGLSQQRLVGHVEPDHCHIEPAREDALRRLRVAPDVELRRRRHVALADRPAH